MDHNKSEFLQNIATMYYVLNMSQHEIASQFNVARSSIARYLNEAKEAGLIRFVITGDHSVQRFTSLENKLIQKYPIKDAVVLNNADENLFFISTISYLNTILPMKGLLGIGGGQTLRKLSNFLSYIDKRPDLNVVQMVGNFHISDNILPTSSLINTWAHYLQSHSTFLAAPALADNVENKRSIQENSVVNQIYDVYKKINLCVIGIGHLSEQTPILNIDFLTDQQKEDIRKDCVGDINLHFFDKNGTFNYDPLSELILGVDRNDYLNIPYRAAIAYGSQKVASIHAAMLGSLANILITDQETAEQLLLRQGE